MIPIPWPQADNKIPLSDQAEYISKKVILEPSVLQDVFVYPL